MTRKNLVALLVSACAASSSPSPPTRALPTDAPVVAKPEPCAAKNMVLVTKGNLRFCIDRYEASLERQSPGGKASPWPGNQRIDTLGLEQELFAVAEPGRKPQGYVSAVQAAAACEQSGKRLCKADEWIAACRGPEDTLYPYGNERRPDVCNDRFEKLDDHPVVRLFREVAEPGTDPKLMWFPRYMNDPRLHEYPRSVAPSGEFEQCTNGYGVYDMVGNLHEWVDDAEGTFLGGFFMDTFQNGEGCAYRTRAHTIEYHDYSTGFRCCAAPAPAG